MPELAEVEYYRRQWEPGLRQKIVRVALHREKRVFRSTPTRTMERRLPGSVLLRSEARGKQMLFQFSKGLWLGLHLGMTGKLRVEGPRFEPGRHDHLVLYQKARALVFSDPRLFGRVLFHETPSTPPWWAKLPPALDSKAFSPEVLSRFLKRHRNLPIKAALLMQDGFPGVGNWMADEILWRAQLHLKTASGSIESRALTVLWRTIRAVCRGAMKHISPNFDDPPRGWLFHERWQRHGRCPSHGLTLKRASVGGRTSVWCPLCQPNR